MGFSLYASIRHSGFVSDVFRTLLIHLCSLFTKFCSFIGQSVSYFICIIAQVPLSFPFHFNLTLLWLQPRPMMVPLFYLSLILQRTGLYAMYFHNLRFFASIAWYSSSQCLPRARFRSFIASSLISSISYSWRRILTDSSSAAVDISDKGGRSESVSSCQDAIKSRVIC